jgi:hypothetical protein
MKKIILIAALTSVCFDVFAQDAASASWTLTSVTSIPAAPVNTGNVIGATEVLTNLVVNTSGTANTYQRLTVPGGSWVAESIQNDTRYTQFSVSPVAANNFNVTNISLGIGADGGTGMKANVAWSQDSTFATSTIIYAAGANFLPSGSDMPIANSTGGILLLNGETLYLRIYPWYKSIATGKSLRVSNVLISGTTSSFFNIPTLSTTAVTNVGSATAQSGGSISVEGGSAITQKGVVWGTSPSPTLLNNAGTTSDGSGLAAYSSNLTGLIPNTVYYVRAYAVNGAGIGYGNEIQFATSLSATNYYNKPGTDVSNRINWGINTNGTGTAPADFSTDAQVFNIVNINGSVLSDWIVSGTDSKVIIGNGISPQSFTIPAAHFLDGTVDVQANATLNVQNTIGLTFGLLNSSAMINFDGTTAVLVNYPNLGLLNNANFPITGTIGISGIFSPGTTAVATVGSTISFIGTNAQVIPTSFTYNILKVNNPNSSFSGNLRVDSSLVFNENFHVKAPDTLTLQAGAELNIPLSKTLTVKGVLDNKSIDPVILNGNLVIDSLATYRVNASVPTSYFIPVGTYKPGSELLILLGQGKLPAIVGGNVTWSSDRTVTFFYNAVNTIGGNFNITAGGVTNGTSSGRTLTIGGDLNISGGLYTITSSGFTNGQSVTVNGNVNVTSGGLNLGQSFDAFSLFIKGNLTHTGGTLGFGSSATVSSYTFIGTNQTISTIGLTNAGIIQIGNASSAPSVLLSTNLSINPDGLLKVFDGNLSIAPNKILTLNGTGDFGGKNVIFKSDSSGTASLGQGTNSITNGNNVTVERYISSLNSPAFRLLAPSVNSTGSIHDNWQTGIAGTGTHITGSTTGANGFDATTSGEPSEFTYNVDITPTTDIVPIWKNIPNTDVKKLEADTGYLIFVRGDRTINLSDSTASSNTTLRSTGTLITGTHTFVNLRPTVYNLVTNPYACGINWTSIRTANPDLIDRYIYWNPNIGSRGGFVMVNGDGSTTPTLPIPGQGLNIPSGEAFFVRPLNTTTVTINESHKSIINTHGDIRLNDGSIERMTTSLFFKMSNGSTRLADGITSDYQNNYSTTIGAEDALQLANFDEDVSILSNNKFLAIEGRPLIDSNETLQLNVTGLKVKAYEWQFKPTNFSNANLTAVLKDKFLGTTIPVSLKETTTVAFNVTLDAASSVADRFQLLYSSIDTSLTLCAGGNSSVTSDTLGTQYQWQMYNGSSFENLVNNANYQGINLVTLQLNNMPSSLYGSRYRCVVTTAGGSANSKVYTLAFKNSWTGAVGSIWGNAANWSCGLVPDGNTDVDITAGPVVVNSNAACRSLKTKAGINVSVNAPATLLVTH